MQNYKTISSPALRDKQKGRCKGGLLILYNQDMELVNTIDICEYWIICKFKNNLNEELIFACAYIPPGKQYDLLIPQLAESLENFNTDSLILGGDFNARTANLTSSPWHVNTNFAQHRTSKDEKLNKRGTQMIDYFSALNLSLLNGHSLSDHRGDFTCTRVTGRSVVDYVWTGCKYTINALDFKIENFSASDHQPCSVKVFMETSKPLFYSESPIEVERVKWAPEKITAFASNMKTPSTTMENANINEMYTELREAIWNAAKNSEMIIKTSCSRHTGTNQPWFNRECRLAKQQVKKAFKFCKGFGFSKANTEKYNHAKETYQKIALAKKQEYYRNIQQSFSNTQRSKEFWEAVKRFRSSNHPTNNVSKEEWEAFYSSTLPERQTDNTQFYGVLYPETDLKFTIEELRCSISKLKTNKSPGTDGITNELLKSLPTAWTEYLLALLNKMFQSESTPNNLVDIEVIMLHKKGCKNDPKNYRGISLINTILKLYTSLILNRLEKWVEHAKLLPEAQAGFRKKRGCAEHIFTLDAIREIFRRKRRKRKLHFLFVDFARAFDSISHKKLWARLNNIGVSPKIIRILSDIYNRAKMKVRTNSGNTKCYDVSEGVLQGELTSPLLFSLYISDIDDVFRELEGLGIRGINIDHNTTLHVLAYADDLVILADCPTHLQAKLDRLALLCEERGLNVNVAKTKILIFHNNHPSNPETPKFTYMNQPIEVVQDFTYLGVTFCECGKFHKHIKNIKTKCAAATEAIVSIIQKSKTVSWDAIQKLKDSLLMSIPGYAIEVYGIYHSDEIESMQLTFLKRLLHLPRYTPGYMLRLETGSKHMINIIIKRSVSWVKKIESLEESRYPYICLKQLRCLANEFTSQTNWIYKLSTQITDGFLNNPASTEQSDCPQLRRNHNDTVPGSQSLQVTEGDHSSSLLTENQLFDAIQQRLEAADIERCEKSSFSSFYHRIKSNGSAALYLNYPMSLNRKRLFCQLRLHPDRLKVLSLYVTNNKYTFSSTTRCTLCNMYENDDLSHLMTNCLIYTPLRQTLRLPYRSKGMLNFHKIVRDSNCEQVKDTCKYVEQALRIRSFIINE